ncbi:MAG: helix-turn-helix transcriptional regulator [Alphaproteobacteria bacterium]|nr:helix-turn-helix transcriptional regulator [Alphaproteobacteria bacterium]
MSDTSKERSDPLGGKTTVLAALLVVQSLAAVFFLGDVIADISLVGFDAHTVVEAMVALALVLGVGFGVLEMRRTIDRVRRSEEALSVASGAFAEVIDGYFHRWDLTPAERDVALLALKGFDVSEIAAMRKVAGGTVRAQLAKVYGKAGVSNRTQLLSIFLDELLGGPVKSGMASGTA